MATGLILRQRVAICFAAGVAGGLSVVLCSQLLFGIGVSGMLGVQAPAGLDPPGVYRPLLWGGLWGIPFGLVVKMVWDRLYVFGLIYFIAPVIALYTVFAPMHGMGFFGAEAGPGMPVYLMLVNVPYGIVTAVVARLLIGGKP
ncbi:MAG TPA: hypothetical protein VGB23_00850 [Nitrospirota bacterium]|jgi:hypothetical protein